MLTHDVRHVWRSCVEDLSFMLSSAPSRPVVAPWRANAMPAEVAAFMQVRSRYFSDLVNTYCGKLQSSGSSALTVFSCASMYCCRSCSHTACVHPHIPLYQDHSVQVFMDLEQL